MISMTKAVKHLLIINVLLFLAKYVLRFKGIDLDVYLALSFPKNELFQPWQLITHMFMHADEMHILFNMLALWMFGSAVEGILGTKRFLILYFIAGLGAVTLHLSASYVEFMNEFNLLVANGFNPEEIYSTIGDGKFMPAWDEVLGKDGGNNFSLQFNIPMLGASGAIMGILAAFGVLLPNAELMLIFLPIPIKAKYFIPGIILLDVFSFFTGVSIFSPSNTAFLAHIGGAITGFLIMMLWKKRNRTYHY